MPKSMKYTNEQSKELAATYIQLLQADPPVDQDAEIDALAAKYETTRRSIIAKLSSLGVYRKKNYTDKQGNPPVKKEEYVEKIAKCLNMDLELLESLSKVNKNILKLILARLEE